MPAFETIAIEVTGPEIPKRISIRTCVKQAESLLFPELTLEVSGSNLDRLRFALRVLWRVLARCMERRTERKRTWNVDEEGADARLLEDFGCAWRTTHRAVRENMVVS